LLQRRIGASLEFRDAPDPLRAVLADREARALLLYHECKPNVAARFLPLKPSTDSRALAASPFTIATEDYALAFRIIGAVDPTSSEAREFLDFLTSDVGQARIAATGYVDLRLRHRQEQVDPTILAVLAQALGEKSIASASRYSTNLRFRVDEYRLDIKAQADLGRLPRALARDFPNGKVVILGFADSTGTAEHNHALSIKRAEFIVGELRPFGIDAAAAGLGQQFPLDTNETEQGRLRNRRAEVWVVQPNN
jgi:phosphate transport system substrate-binding protein